MKQAKALVVGMVLGGLIAMAVPSMRGSDLAGTWLANFALPNAGEMDEFTLVLNKVDKNYSGSIFDSLGYVPKDTSLAKVNLAGNELSFSFYAVGRSLELIMKLTVAGSEMIGQIGMQDTTFPVEFEKVEAKLPG